jgi:hypothetical protein
MKGQLKVISNQVGSRSKMKGFSNGEQPIEVATTIIALGLFYEVTQNKKNIKTGKTLSSGLGNKSKNKIMYNRKMVLPIHWRTNTSISIRRLNLLCFFKNALIMEKYTEKQK